VTVTSAIILSLLVSTFATAGNLALSLPLAWLLRRTKARWSSVLNAVLLLPLALPPTAVGFVLLALFGDRGPLGRERLGIDLGLLFTLRGAVLAAAVVSFPLVFRTVRLTLQNLDPRWFPMARALGFRPFGAFLRVLLPLTIPGLASGALLGFVRCMGEFGATILVAGNIPGETQTLPLALYTAASAGEFHEAWSLLVVSVAVGVVAVFISERATLRARPTQMQR